MVMIAFNRKNKTLRKVFTTKAVVGVVEENLRTYCALVGRVSVVATDDRQPSVER